MEWVDRAARRPLGWSRGSRGGPVGAATQRRRPTSIPAFCGGLFATPAGLAAGGGVGDPQVTPTDHCAAVAEPQLAEKGLSNEASARSLLAVREADADDPGHCSPTTGSDQHPAEVLTPAGRARAERRCTHQAAAAAGARQDGARQESKLVHPARGPPGKSIRLGPLFTAMTAPSAPRIKSLRQVPHAQAATWRVERRDYDQLSAGPEACREARRARGRRTPLCNRDAFPPLELLRAAPLRVCLLISPFDAGNSFLQYPP